MEFADTQLKLEVLESFGYWFSGLVDGEGSFILYCKWQSSTPNFPVRKVGLKIQVRKDDLEMLEYVRDNIGGSISDGGRYVLWMTSKAAVSANILVPLFRKYPLHSKKRHEFELWKKCVLAHYELGLLNKRNPPGTTELNQLFRETQDAISSIRKYRGR